MTSRAPRRAAAAAAAPRRRTPPGTACWAPGPRSRGARGAGGRTRAGRPGAGRRSSLSIVADGGSAARSGPVAVPRSRSGNGGHRASQPGGWPASAAPAGSRSKAPARAVCEEGRLGRHGPGGRPADGGPDEGATPHAVPLWEPERAEPVSWEDLELPERLAAGGSPAVRTLRRQALDPVPVAGQGRSARVAGGRAAPRGLAPVGARTRLPGGVRRPVTAPAPPPCSDRTHRSARIRPLDVRIRARRCVRSARRERCSATDRLPRDQVTGFLEHHQCLLRAESLRLPGWAEPPSCRDDGVCLVLPPDGEGRR